MIQSHDQSSVARRRASALPVSPRNLPTQDLEAVIRRAVELQADTSARLEEGLSEAEVVRIGQELGLDAPTIRRAMAEVRGRRPVEKGLLVNLAGARSIHASRVVNRPATRVAADLEFYLREREFMLAQRRFGNRTRFVRDSSFGAYVARLSRAFGRSPHRPVDLKQIDVSIAAVDADSCLVELSADLAATRAGLVGGLIGSSGAAAVAWAAVAWATALPDSLMLLGVPVLAGAWIGTRAIFGTVRRSVQEKIESLLDPVEHDTLA